MRLLRRMIANARKHPAKGWVWACSPTRALIMTFGSDEPVEGTSSIKHWVSIFLVGSITVTILLCLVNPRVDLRFLALKHPVIVCLLLWLWPISRIVEIVMAFYDDALQLLGRLPRRTTLKAVQRVQFLAASYIEMAINFGLVYFLLADGVMSAMGVFSRHFASPFEAVYFSFVTVTTLGCDITPKTWPGQLLCLSELLCGFVLIVFAFGSYMASGESPSRPKSDAPADTGISAVKAQKEEPSKQTLEQVRTRWQGGLQYKAIEWLKGLAGLAAILGLFIAFFMNSRQLTQLAQSREDERFDKAVSRLGSPSPNERLTGIPGLEQFLNSS